MAYGFSSTDKSKHELGDHIFSVNASAWVANTGSVSPFSDYPYIATIATDLYADDSKPIWRMNGLGDIPTLTERESIYMISEAIFSSNRIVLYADSKPTSNLVLEVKGV